MARQNWILQDFQSNVNADPFVFSEVLKSSATSKPVCCRLSKRRLHGGLSDGVDMIDWDNGVLSLSVVPTRGMGIWRGRCGDVELKWNSPVSGPVHPNFVPVTDSGGLGWLEGFDEWLVRCGLESNGSPEFDSQGRLKYPLHGRIANLPAKELSFSVDRETGEMQLSGKVFESKLFFKKLELQSTLSTFAGSTKFTVRDTITNHSSEPGEFELLYHINTGLPFASPGARFHIPFEKMAPRTSLAAEQIGQWNRLDPETPGSTEVVYFFDPAGNQDGICKTMLVNAIGDRGMVLSFSKSSFPCFSFWKSRLQDGDGYVCGVEPATNYPNTKSFEKSNSRVVQLPPKESRTFELQFEILLDAGSVNAVKQEIDQFGAHGIVEPAPLAEWSE